MRRRLFLEWLVRLVGTLWAGSGLYALWRFLRPPRENVGSSTSGYRVGSADMLAPGSSRVVFVADRPVLLIRRNEHQWLAFSALCTHRRCGVSWAPQRDVILCPCHGGVFDLSGNVLQGPPPSALPRYAVEVVHGQVYIRF
ncbi:Cytochrome b6-f complex iron-sulfur subunit [bacterium HR11]|nr:Cytochrome b6-f complex iron-sulfur subunit [bacterium HR11]